MNQKITPLKAAKHKLMLILYIILTLFTATFVRAQVNTNEIDMIFNWATTTSPGCVCAVSEKGTLIVNRAYGLADLERNVPLTPTSIFDAGSLTKQFVAAAVLLLAADGRLSLSDDVRQYIPELHDYGHTITIDHLLTHTSGLRDWTGILPLVDGDIDALTIALRQRGLNFVPGEEWSYSNSGYVLAKEIVARITGMSFGAYAQLRLFTPLGMMSTTYRHDLHEVIQNRALAYDQEGEAWKISMLFDNDRGGGGALFSTAEDLLIWNDALTSGRLGAFVTEKLQETSSLSNGRKLNYARGLFLAVNSDEKIVWHTGSAAGYKSLLARYPEHGLSIAIMCNSGDGTRTTQLAGRILDLLVPEDNAEESDGPPAFADGVDTAGINLTSRTGLYFNASTGHAMRLVVHEDRLRVANGPFLVAMGGNRFRRWGAILEYMSQDQFELRFVTQDEFELKSMEGKLSRYRRARAYSPTSTDLITFVGRYESDEIGTIFRVDVGKDGLVLRIDHAPAKQLSFKPIDPDTFQWGRMTIRFLRSKDDHIEGLEYTNPIIRNVRFIKLPANQ